MFNVWEDILSVFVVMSLEKNLMENVLSICKEAIPYFYDEICHPNKILTVIAFISISLLLICSKSTANNGDDQCELLRRPSYIFLLNRPHLRSPHKYGIITNEMSSPTTTWPFLSQPSRFMFLVV